MKKQVFFFLMGTALCLFSCRPSSRTSEATDVHEETTVSDSVQTCKGRLIMSHEAYSFTPEGDTLSYWVVDRSGELKKRYEAALPAGSQPYTPVSAQLKVKMMGPSSEGFAADYDGVVEVLQIIRVGD